MSVDDRDQRLDQRRRRVEHGDSLQLHPLRFGQLFEFNVDIEQRLDMVAEETDGATSTWRRPSRCRSSIADSTVGPSQASPERPWLW